MNENGRLGPLEWATAVRPRAGEQVCGDRAIAVAVDGTAALIGVLDGLGHGADAATAALCGVMVLDEARAKPLEVLVQHCHRALSGTRGAAMTLARIDFGATDTLRWIGIGNVSADLVAKHPGGVEVRSSARLIGGIVGYRLPEGITPQEVPIRPGDLLVIASDGIAEDHLADIDFAAPSTVIAEQILSRHGKQTDDALVLAARHRGTTG
ncbi:SpoIIE family protein phosphatase [Mycobacterium celatum]|uniref:Stage II sporulation protein M n=1 Tax=Mycobacterium celatum TaxID=28045 RepID=A0A1X1RKP7_MYCCE|nr:SpoIIE family protein phosphatase [Mycobacterium celatum]ORV08388.1 stage II sporulation protein M [Mycobacterium celatum]PIB78466.1 stage II sporulation protein M [Mycobacterium celatum]